MQEAKSSLNFFGVTKKGWHCQFTLRDDSEETLLERFGRFVLLLEGKGIAPEGRAGSPVTTAAVAVAAPEPAKPAAASVPAANGNGHHDNEQFEIVEGGVIAIVANEKGEKSYKFKGGKYKQYGVRVWPETLEKLGWKLDSLKVGQEYDLKNLRSKILTASGKAKKVAEFLPMDSGIDK